MTKTTAGQRPWRRRAIPVAVVVLVVGAVAGTRAFATGAGGPSYRLALVTRGSVDQTLTLSGTVRKAAQATTSFAQSGTVQSVAVAVGDEVTAGQTLATLDPTALRRAVIAAEATLAQARATLATDEASAATVGYDRFTTTPSEVFAITTALVLSTGPPRTPAQAAAAVQKAAAAVAAAQQAAQSALAAVTSAEQAQDTTCAPVLAGTATTAQVADCVQAVQATSAAQADAAGAQAAVTTAQSNLATALTAQARILASTSSGSGGSGSTSSGSGGSGSGGGGGGTGAAGTGSSPERIASDRAAVTSAQSALSTAEADLAAATLTAPISGTVAAVGYVAGSASGSNGITIVGPGAVDVTVNVPLASLPKVKVGQAARVGSAGSAATVAGTVRSISLLPASSTSTSVSYPVVVRVPQPTAAMASGSAATATITLSTVKGVLTVPNSALTSLTSGTAIATVVKNGTAVRTLVRTGAVGPTRTQVLSGLTDGQQVVIADLSEALPTNTFGNNGFGNRSGLTSSLSGAGGLGAGGLGGGRVFVNGGPPPG